MRTFAQKQQPTQKVKSSSSARPSRTFSGQNSEVNSIHHLQRNIGNHAVLRMLQTHAEQPDVGMTAAASPRFRHDFSQIPIHAPAGGVMQTKLTINKPGDEYEQEADRVAEQVIHAPEPQLQRSYIHSLQTQSKTVDPSQKPKRLQMKRIQTGNEGQDTAPQIVHDVLQSSGRPLETATREFMETRFGCDFSQVRVHAGAKASESAQAMNANAYTVEHNIVFGAGRFTPSTTDGQWLIAHELSHVLQQRSVEKPLVMREPASQSPPTMGRMPEGQSQQATVADRREFAQEAIRFLEGQGDFFTLQTNRDTAEVLRLLRTTTNSALTVIANDASLGTIADRVRVTYNAAVRTVLVSRTVAQPNSVRTPPTLQQLYEQHRDNILPFALPQAQVDTGAAELSNELSAQLPPGATRAQRTRLTAIRAARQRLRVVTSQVNTSFASLFSTQGGTTTIPLPANTSARFSSTIPATLRRGLQSLGAQLIDTPLTANSTVVLALDLTPFGGSYASYRFTRIDLGTLGTEIWIERQGTIGIEGLTTEQRTTLRARFDRVGFRRGSGFNQDEFDQVLIGLGEIPEAHLSPLGALRFEQVSSDPQDSSAAAHYDQSVHTVRVFDRAYNSGLTRMGRAGRPLKFAAHAVAHEVGHARDLSSLRTTAAATSAAQSALLAEFGTGGTGPSIPNRRDPQRARFDQLNTGVTSATAAESAARSLSGARWTAGNPSEVTDALVARARQPAFRQAALRDGGGTMRMPTDYPNPDSVWQEYFADSFSLYQTSPDLLRRIRPNVFDYMTREFPL